MVEIVDWMVLSMGVLVVSSVLKSLMPSLMPLLNQPLQHFT